MKKIDEFLNKNMVGKAILFIFKSIVYTVKPELKKPIEKTGELAVNVAAKQTSEVVKFGVVILVILLGLGSYFGKVDVTILEDVQEVIEEVKPLAVDSLAKDTLKVDSLVVDSAK